MKKINKLLLLTTVLALTGCGKDTVTLTANLDLAVIPETFDTYEQVFKEDRIPDQFVEYGIGDPFIYRFNGVYYLICSTKATVKGVKGWKSTDLMHWEKVSNGVTKDGYIVGDDVNESFDAWASEVYYLDGKFYLCESRHGEGHYIFESNSPEGPFLPITESTIDNKIDGSMYMDVDGRMTMVNANGSVAGKHFASDMKSFVDDEVLIPNTSIVGWTEGPELLTRDGIRYYIYTGNGVTQRAYRCDYSYGPASDPILSGEHVKNGHNLVLNTDDDWYGLGHTCVVLGPDLDSYYMGFHNSYAEGNSGGRRFNIGRLLFNGADLTMQHVGRLNNIVPNLPDFVERDISRLETVGDFKLSNVSTGDSFTVEFNVKGTGKSVFSFVDANNFGYASFTGDKVEIHKVSGGSDSLVGTAKTLRTFNKDVLHAIRLGYKNGLMDVSFDLQEIANDINVGEFKGGKVGYSSSYSEIGCLTFNNTAQGDSDKETAKQEIIPVTTYTEKLSHLSEESGLVDSHKEIVDEIVTDSKTMKLGKAGDYVTYLEYASESGSYAIDLTVPETSFGKTIGIQVDGGEIRKWQIPDYSNQMKKGYILTKVGEMNLTAGNHNITLVNLGDEVEFQRIAIERNFSKSGVEYNHPLTSYPDNGIGYPTFMMIDSNGLSATNDKRNLVTFGDGTIENAEMSVDCKILGENGTGTFGIVMAADNWAFNNTDLDNYKSIQGYYFALNTAKVTIIDSNYQYTKETCRDVYMFDTDVVYNIKAIKQGKILKMFVNNVQVLEYFSPTGKERGYLGIYSNYMNVQFTNLKIKTL